MLERYIKGLNISKDKLPVEGLKGLYYDGNIIIDKSVETQAETLCILAEELGHHYTSHGDILDYEKNIKQEKLARKWATEKVVPLESFIWIYKNKCRSIFEASELLGVTETFFKESVEHYKDKYGKFTEHQGYLIYFEPLGILEKR